jgi:hypothetical protein
LPIKGQVQKTASRILACKGLQNIFARLVPSTSLGKYIIAFDNKGNSRLAIVVTLLSFNSGTRNCKFQSILTHSFFSNINQEILIYSGMLIDYLVKLAWYRDFEISVLKQ